jgi:soluble lytic murein transglycosylase
MAGIAVTLNPFLDPAAAQSRLLNDTVYNMQIGAAELADDIGRYSGSYVLAFAGYNAGQW